MADDASKPNAKPEAKAARPKLIARPQPERDPVALANEIIDRYPIIMARLAE